jgi:hypothetical protein
MSLFSFCDWLQNTALSTGIRESVWTFPAIETVHLMSLGVSVGTIMFVDLRLIGKVMPDRPVRDVIDQLQPWTLWGFAVQFLTGILLFLSEPLRCYYSAFFAMKFVLLALLGLNALVFHRTVYRSVAQWNEAIAVPARARIAGYVSLTLWACVILLGRGIAYTARPGF